jgi:hypothetical protein
MEMISAVWVFVVIVGGAVTLYRMPGRDLYD